MYMLLSPLLSSLPLTPTFRGPHLLCLWGFLLQFLALGTTSAALLVQSPQVIIKVIDSTLQVAVGDRINFHAKAILHTSPAPAILAAHTSVLNATSQQSPENVKHVAFMLNGKVVKTCLSAECQIGLNPVSCGRYEILALAKFKNHTAIFSTPLVFTVNPLQQ